MYKRDVALNNLQWLIYHQTNKPVDTEVFFREILILL